MWTHAPLRLLRRLKNVNVVAGGQSVNRFKIGENCSEFFMMVWGQPVLYFQSRACSIWFACLSYNVQTCSYNIDEFIRDFLPADYVFLLLSWHRLGKSTKGSWQHTALRTHQDANNMITYFLSPLQDLMKRG
jgi:hypothetical protein